MGAGERKKLPNQGWDYRVDQNERSTEMSNAVRESVECKNLKIASA